MRHAIQGQTMIQIQITTHKEIAVIVSIAMTVVVDADVIADVIAIVIVETVKSASQLSQKMMYCFQSADF
jgi:tRNA-binding EMAP/Myf-like protein